MNDATPFKWRHFEAEIILLCVRWYLRYSLSYRDLEEMMAERGLHVDHTTIYRWVQRYAPELDKRCRPHLKACNDSWKVDETYIKIKKTWMYLYRAVDSEGNTLEFLLSPTRDAEAAKRFFLKALHSTAGSAPRVRPVQEQVEEPTALADPNPTKSAPRVINVDKNAAYPKAMAELKAAGILPESVELRQVKYLNNLIEQDHRFIKRVVKPGMGFFSLETAGRTLQGYEGMHMIRKGQMQGVAKGDIGGQVTFIARNGPRPLTPGPTASDSPHERAAPVDPHPREGGGSRSRSDRGGSLPRGDLWGKSLAERPVAA
jgi:transposase, IS6 family